MVKETVMVKINSGEIFLKKTIIQIKQIPNKKFLYFFF